MKWLPVFAIVSFPIYPWNPLSDGSTVKSSFLLSTSCSTPTTIRMQKLSHFLYDRSRQVLLALACRLATQLIRRPVLHILHVEMTWFRWPCCSSVNLRGRKQLRLTATHGGRCLSIRGMRTVLSSRQLARSRIGAMASRTIRLHKKEITIA